MSEVNRQWILVRRPAGAMNGDEFEQRETAVDDEALGPNQVRIRNVAFLCAPTMRNWMDAPGNNFYPSVPLGEVMMAPAVGRVVASTDAAFPEGSRVYTISTWQDYATIPTDAGLPLHRIPDGLTFLEGIGRYGLNPLTAYFGLLEVGQPVAGETLVVSGAAGSTGSTAAQIGKIKGCRVIGIAGGTDKCRWLTEDCGLDAAVDYKQGDVSARLAELCPDGINVFFDNVGGDMLQAAVDNIAPFGRIVLCGQIASYDSGESPEGPRNMMRLIYGAVRMQGFLCGNYAAQFPRAVADLQQWTAEGRIQYREDLHTGFDQLPQAFAKLFRGANQGTLLVAIADEAGAAA